MRVSRCAMRHTSQKSTAGFSYFVAPAFSTPTICSRIFSAPDPTRKRPTIPDPTRGYEYTRKPIVVVITKPDASSRQSVGGALLNMCAIRRRLNVSAAEQGLTCVCVWTRSLLVQTVKATTTRRSSTRLGGDCTELELIDSRDTCL